MSSSESQQVVAAACRVEAEQTGAVYTRGPQVSIITMAQQWAMAMPVPSFTSRSARSLFGIAEVDRLGAWALA